MMIAASQRAAPSVSPRTSQAIKATSTIWALAITPPSSAVNVRKARFHNVKARAVLIRLSQANNTTDDRLSRGNGSTNRLTRSSSVLPMPMLIMETSRARRGRSRIRWRVSRLPAAPPTAATIPNTTPRDSIPSGLAGKNTYTPTIVSNTPIHCRGEVGSASRRPLNKATVSGIPAWKIKLAVVTGSNFRLMNIAPGTMA